jgi:hypothetical protein
MAKFRMKVKGLARVSQIVEIEADNLDAACELAEQEYADTDLGWRIDDMVTRGPDAVQVVTGSWERLNDS